MADGGNVIFKFTGDTSNLDKSIGKTDSALGTLAKSFTIAQVASNALNKAIGLISDNLDAAISRFDTMNNFPKVMENLGFNADDASKAVETLSDGLMGLPTALDDSISYVQRFTAKNDDLEKSSQIFLAINDAILAGGGSAQTQSAAIEQFAQSFSKGKPDLMEWRTLLTAMPGQLKQIAKSMGYASADDLYEAFKANKISMDDFTDAVIRLDKEGIDGMASFSEQAKSATQGIGTSIKNLKTRIARALTEVLNKIDDGLKAYGGISGVIEKLSKVITNIISKVGNGISFILKNMPKIINAIKPLLPVIEGIFAAFIAYKVITGIINGISVAMAALNAIMMMNPYVLLASAIAGVAVAAVALHNALETSTEDEKREAEAMKELAKQSAETKKAYDDLTEAKNKQISEGMSEMNYVQQLANELRTLADSQGNVAEKDRARAEFILNELNTALGTEYKMIDGQIQKYDELSASIDKQIEKKRMEIMFQAREEEYRKSLSEWTDLQKQKEEARLKVQEAQAAFEEHEGRANAERLTAAIENYDNLDQAVKQASTNIRTYEDAYTENLKGNTEAATKLLLDKEKSFTSLKDVATKSQEEQTRILKEQEDKALQDLEEYRKKYKEGVAGYTSDGLIEAANYASKAKEEYKKIGQNMNEGLEQGLSNTETKVTEQVQEESWNMLDWFKSILGIHSPSTVLYGYGKNINQGLINGLNSNSGSVTSTMGRIGQNLLSRMKNVLGIHSPSRVFRDAIGKNIALGIGEGFESEMESVENDISKTLRNIAPSLELGNLFDLSPTLHNTTTSNSNVNVQVINNMETDFMGNLISNIKTYSNGAKNDYNYGMT